MSLKQKTILRIQFLVLISLGTFLLSHYYVYQVSQIENKSSNLSFNRKLNNDFIRAFNSKKSQSDIELDNVKIAVEKDQNIRIDEETKKIEKGEQLKRKQTGDIFDRNASKNDEAKDLKPRINKHGMLVLEGTKSMYRENPFKKVANKVPSEGLLDEIKKYQSKYGNDIEVMKMKLRMGLVNDTEGEFEEDEDIIAENRDV